DPRMFQQNITLPQETVFFRRAHFEKVAALDESLAFSMDFDLWVRLSKITTLKHVPAFLGYYREHDASKSTVFHESGRNEADQYLAEHQRVFRKHFGREL